MAEKLQRGLEGVIAAETKISSIIESQLTYAGYDIDDLAENAQFEEVIFLLWNYRLPNEEELAHLKGKLNQYIHWAFCRIRNRLDILVLLDYYRYG